MDDEDGQLDWTPGSDCSIATNVKHIAFASGDTLFYRPLINGDGAPHLIRHNHGYTRAPALALSVARDSHLAVSFRGQVRVYDADANILRSASPDSSRVVTCLAWSQTDPNTLIAGHIDGSICIWNFGRPSRPQKRLLRSDTACKALAHNNTAIEILASAHGGSILVWSPRLSSRPVKVIREAFGGVTSLYWHATLHGSLLSVSSDDVLRVWDVTSAVSANASTRRDEDSDDDGFFGKPEGIVKATHPIAQWRPTSSVVGAGWLGEHGVYALLNHGAEVAVYSFGADWEMSHEVWRFKTDFEARSATLVNNLDGAARIIVANLSDFQSYRIPSAVLDSVGGLAQMTTLRTSTKASDHAVQKGHLPSQNVQSRTGGVAMRPVRLSLKVAQKSRQLKIFKQQQDFREVVSIKRKALSAAQDNRPETPVTPRSQTMTSSLELPKPKGEDHDSSMPFLSPSIPSRKPSPNAISPIEDDLRLPPLQDPSFDTLPSTDHESDSDDETFAAGMQGSGTFLPGGINVPLPKACGALFTPNGQLLVFFPPKPQRAALQDERQEPHSEQTNQRQARRVTNLFSTFGNLAPSVDYSDESSEDDDMSTSVAGLPAILPTLALQPSSFPSQLDRNLHNLTTTPAKAPEHPGKIVVQIRESSPQPSSRHSTALLYRIICKDNESGSDLCRHNANVASDAGLDDATSVWLLLRLVLEDRVPLEAVIRDGRDEDILKVADRATTMFLGENGTDLDTTEHATLFGKIRWADSPFGASWLVKRCFDWAERNADVQSLALMSAVLAETDQIIPQRHATIEQSSFRGLPTFGLDYELHDPGASRPSIPPLRSIPTLRTTSDLDNMVYQSPTKLRQASQPSSRNQSQPSTPYLDSATSTPPSVFPPFSRSSTRLSASGSGSASPELHRSSFSAAARHYAQSITDKFASYGTSPPTKKLSASTSPSANELSSSLPTGSWSKSVSFASTAPTARDSQLSRSYTTTDEADGYDSDKTIDDSSLPHTPKTGNANVVVNLPNEHMFSDNVSGAAKQPLLPADLAAKAVLWRSYYAEQLRCWGLYTKAAEIEKASGLTSSSPQRPVAHDGIVPTRVPGARRATCSICFATVRGLQQVCPACFHTTHLDCMQSYLASMEADEVFECPAGCGCACADLP